MSEAIKSNMGDWAAGFGSDANNTTKSTIIPGKSGVQAVCEALDATGANSGAIVHAFKAQFGKKTTVKTTTADAATTIVLNGDDGTGYINGYQIADNDYLLVATNAGSADDASNKGHGWRLLLISGATETGASDQVSCTVAGLDGHTGIEGTVTAGAVAYVIPASSFASFTIGSATIAKVNVMAGEVGAPIGFIVVPAAAAAHDLAVKGVYR